MQQAATKRQPRQQTASVLWLVPDKPDNISTGRQRIAHGLRERGHDVLLVDGRGEALQAARTGWDVVLGTTAWLGAAAPLAGDSKIIVDYVDPIDQLRRSYGPVERLAAYALHRNALRSADGVLYVYDRVASELDGLTAHSAQTSLGVDYQRFAEPSKDASGSAAARLSAAGVDGDFAIYIGGLEPPYNPSAMLDAFERTDAQLVVAGTGSERASVESRARARENVTYLGLVDHEIVPGLLTHASVGLCLVDDPHTVKVLEYAAADLPVVHIRGSAESRYTGQTMYWCNGRAPSVADAVDRALKYQQPSLTDAWVRRHDYSSVIDDYEQMIQRVV
jgi:glycosyltransferase involved in cell wall biosynthesis